MGRLARDLRWRGEGLGELLVGLAVERCWQARRSVGGLALIVDAKGEASRSFYLHYGFWPCLDPRTASTCRWEGKEGSVEGRVGLPRTSKRVTVPKRLV